MARVIKQVFFFYNLLRLYDLSINGSFSSNLKYTVSAQRQVEQPTLKYLTNYLSFYNDDVFTFENFLSKPSSL